MQFLVTIPDDTMERFDDESEIEDSLAGAVEDALWLDSVQVHVKRVKI